MDNIIFLTGDNPHSEKETIESNKSSPVYIFKGKNVELYQYIDYLHDELGVGNKIIHKMRICKYVDFGGFVSLYKKDSEVITLRNIVELLEHIERGNEYVIVIENDDRNMLACILQQLIYIDYPITEINLKLRREYKDAVKSYEFMRNIDDLYMTCISAYDNIEKIELPESSTNYDDLQSIKVKTHMAYQQISEQIKKAKDVEMKVAVAASKKTGKSVIVNSMIGEQIAPTSLSLPTPNTCKYRKSTDSNYHLFDGSSTLSYSSRKSIYIDLDKRFKEAQKRSDFTLPDMEISYISNGNNFESYTIYDTPGPDFAGQNVKGKNGGHELSAYKAMEECDVAIFGIDYSKYLTTDEETYLKRIKNIFEKKHKFHTLIFVINKIDLALADRGTNSKARAIDYIHYCLKKIDVAYSDCVIFTTSAQDYFFSLELLEETKKNPELADLADDNTDLFLQLPKTIAELDEDIDEDLSRILSCINAEVSKIKTQLGYKKINLKTFQEYSGIPQLLNYVSYVAKSKARDEIVNSITYAIDNQYNELRTIIDKLANIKELKDKTADEIVKIEGILNEYSGEVNELLKPDLDDSDLVSAEKFLKPIYMKYKNILNTERISIEELLRYAYREVEDVDDIILLDDIWRKVRSAQTKKLEDCLGKIVTQDKIQLDEYEIRDYVETEIRYLMREKENRCKHNLEGLKEDILGVLNHRNSLIEEKTMKCKDRLKKESVNLIFPEMPKFDANLDFPKLNQPLPRFEGKIKSSLISKSFEQIGKVHQFFRNVFKNKFKFDTVEFKVPNSTEVSGLVEKLHEPLCDAIRESKIHDAIVDQLRGLTNEASKQNNVVLEEFGKQNQNCLKNIEYFKSVLDDREKYEDDLAALKSTESLIQKIESASDQFLGIWHKVISK